MSGSQGSDGERYSFDGAQVYLHVTYVGDERILHLDIDHPDLNAIFRPRESSYVGGHAGGIYVGLRGEHADRAEGFLKDRSPDARRAAPPRQRGGSARARPGRRGRPRR